MRADLFPQIILATSTSPESPGKETNIPQIPSEAYVKVEIDPDGLQWPWRVFKSSSLTPPNLTITGNGGELAPGYIFMTPEGVNERVPRVNEEDGNGFIITTNNELVYGLDVDRLTDFRVQEYQGSSYLTC